jgi:hypothetical protein
MTSQLVGVDDLDFLTREGGQPTCIKRLRDHHYQLARVLAEGMRTNEAAAYLGMSVSRVSILRSDPLFKELVDRYRGECEAVRDEAFADVQRKEALLLANALDWKNDRYEERPEEISAEENIEDMKFAHEAIYGKESKHLNVNVTVPDAAEHEARRKFIDEQVLPAPCPGQPDFCRFHYG